MMKTTWLFAEGFNDDQAQRLATAASAVGCETVTVGPASSWRRDRPTRPMIAYGPITFLRCFQTNGAMPWAWLDLDNLKCSAFMAHWGQFSIHRDYAFHPYREVVRRWGKLFQRMLDFPSCGRLFIRPDASTKIFDGALWRLEEKEKFMAETAFNSPDPHSFCLVSREELIAREFRTVVAGGMVIAMSQYWANGKMAIEQPASNVAGDVASFIEDEILASSDWRPDRVFVLDVAETVHYGYRLLELGSVNCSSLYACDPTEVVEACNAAAIVEWSDIHETA